VKNRFQILLFLTQLVPLQSGDTIVKAEVISGADRLVNGTR
jgi:hypothetical protein